MSQSVIFNDVFNPGIDNVTEPFYEGIGFYFEVGEDDIEDLVLWLQLRTQTGANNNNEWKRVITLDTTFSVTDTQVVYILPQEFRNSLEEKRILFDGLRFSTPVKIWLIQDDQPSNYDLNLSLSDILDKIEELKQSCNVESNENQQWLEIIWDVIRIIAINQGIPLPSLPSIPGNSNNVLPLPLPPSNYLPPAL